MDRSIVDALRGMRIGVLLALLGVLFGFAAGGAFGFFEDTLKAGLAADAESVLATVYSGDSASARAVVDKAWSYYKRAHLHGGGIGAAALAVMLVMACSAVSPAASRLAAYALGGGAIGYPVFWLLAGMRAPVLGSTAAAKESLRWLAFPSSAALLLGLVVAVAARHVVAAAAR